MWLSERDKKSVHVIKSHRRDWPQGGWQFGLSGRHRNYSQTGRSQSQEEESAGRQKAGKAQRGRDLWRDRRGHKRELSPCWERGELELLLWPEVWGHAWWGREEEGMKGEEMHPETLPSLPWMVASFCPKLIHFWTHLFLAGNCVNVYPNVLSLCVCVCTRMHMCVCMIMGTYVAVKVPGWMFFLSLSTIVLRGFSLKLELTDWLAWVASGIHRELPVTAYKPWNCRYVWACLTFYIVLGIWT